MFNKRLLKEFSEFKGSVIIMVLTQWIMMLANVVWVYFFAKIITSVVNGLRVGNEEQKAYAVDNLSLWIKELAICLLVVLVIRGISNFINTRVSYKTSATLKKRLREMIYSKLMVLGDHYHDNFSTSEITQISTEGVEQLEIYFGKYVPQFFYALLAPLTLFVIVSTMSFKVAIVLLICVPLIPMAIVAVQKFAKKMLAKYWGTYTELGDTFLESLQALTTLKIYQADEEYAKRMDEESEKFRKVTMKVLIMQLNSISIMDLVAYGGAGLGIILSMFEFAYGNITLYECIFIILISAEFFLPMRMLGSFFHIAMNGNAAADKIFRLLDTPEPEKISSVEFNNSNIEVSNVSFSYEEDKQVLNDISVNFDKGLTSLVGESGCGKSTIISLLMKEYDAKTGKLVLGEKNYKDFSRDDLLKKITRVSHDSYIFAGTLRENLLMGNINASENELIEAIKEVDLYDFVNSQGGLDMQILEKGANLSGGQKQRLAIARALLHDSDIYIFDEAASNVDVESENQIMQVVRKLATSKTVILVSHRLANVVNADDIYVMKNGNIIEHGKHTLLMDNNDYYAKLFNEQMKLEKYGRREA